MRTMLGRTFLVLGALMGALVLVGSAAAVPPVLSSVSSQDRHPTATFSAPKSDHVVIEIASKPDRATDGEFLSENEVVFDVLTDSEIQAGRWLYDSQLDPGTYYVLLRASPNFDLCYQSGGSYDPSCADGYAELQTLTVPTPSVRYRASVKRESWLHEVELQLTATPLGIKQPYRVCYLTAATKKSRAKQRCLTGVLGGYSWNSSADDTLTVSSRALARFTTFTWTVDGRTVARVRARTG